MLLNAGYGFFDNKDEEQKEILKIPSEILCASDNISEIFGFDTIKVNDDSVIRKFILTPTNADVLELNDQILVKLEREAFDYFSVDKQRMTAMEI